VIRWVVTLVTALALLIVLLFSVEDEEERAALRSPHAVDREPRCPKPRVTDLTARRASEDGYRVKLRVRARMTRSGIGALEVWWGKRAGLIADGWWGRRAAADFEHRYPGPGTYRITVVAEGSTQGCKRLQKSQPATLRVRVPLTTSYPSSP
jgi:hypothetical protein